VHPHSFRHLFAKEFISNGGSQMELADILRTREPRHNKNLHNKEYCRAKRNFKQDAQKQKQNALNYI